jgi:hypothetical protein
VGSRVYSDEYSSVVAMLDKAASRPARAARAPVAKMRVQVDRRGGEGDSRGRGPMAAFESWVRALMGPAGDVGPASGPVWDSTHR